MWSLITSNQIHWPRRIETKKIGLDYSKSTILPTKSIDPEGLKLILCMAYFTFSGKLPTKSIDPEGLKLVSPTYELHTIAPSNQIHWPRRIETMPQMSEQQADQNFQPNPLTQKDWNIHNHHIEQQCWLLPTKSIDPEGLKHLAPIGLIELKFSSNQIHWPRRIETCVDTGNGNGNRILPTKSIDPEGLKHV